MTTYINIYHISPHLAMSEKIDFTCMPSDIGVQIIKFVATSFENGVQ